MTLEGKMTSSEALIELENVRYKYRGGASQGDAFTKHERKVHGLIAGNGPQAKQIEGEGYLISNRCSAQAEVLGSKGHVNGGAGRKKLAFEILENHGHVAG